MTENRTEMKRREYLIGDMSEIVGISRDTLRFYEKKGIIKSRKKENGYEWVIEIWIFKWASKGNSFMDFSIVIYIKNNIANKV